MSSDQQELQARSLSLTPHVEIKHILFLKASISKLTKSQSQPKVLLFMADLDSSEIKISGAYCAIRDIYAKLKKMCSYGDLQGARDSTHID